MVTTGMCSRNHRGRVQILQLPQRQAWLLRQGSTASSPVSHLWLTTGALVPGAKWAPDGLCLLSASEDNWCARYAPAMTLCWVGCCPPPRTSPVAGLSTLGVQPASVRPAS